VNESGWLGFVVAVLATWRLAHLLAREDGPFDAVLWLRRRAGDGMWGRLMDCPYCLSLWLAPVPAAWLALQFNASAIHAVLLWLAVSGGACWLERLATARAPNREEP
jgi:hypothetical protein